MAASSRLMASVASVRTATITSLAPIAKAAMAAPSMTAYGSRSRRKRSVPVAGSAPYPLMTTYRRGASVAAAVRHLFAAGNPAPPRPRSPEPKIIAVVAAAPRSRTTRRRPSKAPARLAASRSVGSVASVGSTRSRRTVGQAPGVLRIVVMPSGPRRGAGIDRPARSLATVRAPRPSTGASCQRGVEGGDVAGFGRTVIRHRARLDGRLRGLEAQVAVVAGGAIDHRVPGSGPLADPLQRGDREVAVRRLRRLEDAEHVARVVVEVLEDRVDRADVDLCEAPVHGIRDGSAGPAQRRFLAPFAVCLGRPPVHVETSAGVHAAHVDAFDRTRLGALEAGLAFERAPLVIEQLEPPAELGRLVAPFLGVHDRDFRVEETTQGQRHPLRDAETRNQRHQDALADSNTTIAAAVTNRLSSEAGSSHFQAKSISWSIRTRGSVPRIQTNVKTRTYVLPRNHRSPATQSSPR